MKNALLLFLAMLSAFVITGNATASELILEHSVHEVRDTLLTGEDLSGGAGSDDELIAVLDDTARMNGASGALLGWELRAGAHEERYRRSIPSRSTAKIAVNEFYGQTGTGEQSAVFGRKKVRWGVGYSVSPTDLVTSQRNPLDTMDRLREVSGTDMLSYAVRGARGQADVLYLPALDWSNDAKLLTSRAAFRYYQTIDALSLSVVARVHRAADYHAGMNAVGTIGRSLELHGEYLYASKDAVPRPLADGSQAQLTGGDWYTEANKSSHEALLGGHYTFDNLVNLTVELYYHGSGYDRGEWTAYIRRLELAKSGYQDPLLRPLALNERYFNASVFNVPMRKHYVFSRLYKEKVLFSTDVEWILLYNIDDKGFMQQFNCTYSGFDWGALYGMVTTFSGDPRSEFGSIPENIVYNAGVRYAF